ncbi:uncharacterized protein LOC127805981 isoform X10 [Diospyros lotus]|uniref:uncharacterized protein LOC127805981 isoform X10 n=1 Tax=Diospyros lotus TaxID=55363 RepID=UPI002258E864|nr:uncharacterized protein LOC127805981 isoform X10 [Diospyros lotus]
MYLCWRKRRGFSRELVFKEEIDRKLCAFGNYWLVLKGTIFRLSGITAYSSFQEAIWGQTFQTGLSKLEEFSCVEVDVIRWRTLTLRLVCEPPCFLLNECK